MAEIPKVRRGQEWKDNDTRFDARVIRVMSIVGQIAACINVATGRVTRISLHRFNPNRKTGYTLVREATR